MYEGCALEIVDKHVAEIKPYKSNPRVNQGAVDAVAKSIQQFGFQQPIVIDESNTIIVGHTRFKAALQLGMTHVPVHIASGLSKAQIKAYRIADNQTSNLSDWDFELLPLELDALKLDGFDMSALGFGEARLRELQGIEGGVNTTSGNAKTPVTCPECGYVFE